MLTARGSTSIMGAGRVPPDGTSHRRWANMGLFLSACVAGVNLPYTILLAVTLLYWISVIMGVFDLDLLGGGGEGAADAGGDLGLGGGDVGGDLDAGGDVDVGGDVDAGGDVEAGGDVDVGADAGFLGAVPKFLSLGGVPVTVFFSFFSLSAWAISMAANHVLGNTSLLVALGMAVPIVLISLLVARIASAPFGSLFRVLGKEHEQHEKVVGKTCVISTSRADGGFGQAEVETSGAPLLLNVRTVEGVTLRKGEQALIIRYDPEKHLYIVQPYTSPIPELEDTSRKP